MTVRINHASITVRQGVYGQSAFFLCDLCASAVKLLRHLENRQKFQGNPARIDPFFQPLV